MPRSLKAATQQREFFTCLPFWSTFDTFTSGETAGVKDWDKSFGLGTHRAVPEHPVDTGTKVRVPRPRRCPERGGGFVSPHSSLPKTLRALTDRTPTTKQEFGWDGSHLARANELRQNKQKRTKLPESFQKAQLLQLAGPGSPLLPVNLPAIFSSTSHLPCSGRAEGDVRVPVRPWHLDFCLSLLETCCLLTLFQSTQST